MSIERRLRRLESAQAGDGRVIEIRKLVNESNLGAMRRYFGDPEPPPYLPKALVETTSAKAYMSLIGELRI